MKRKLTHEEYLKRLVKEEDAFARTYPLANTKKKGRRPNISVINGTGVA